MSRSDATRARLLEAATEEFSRYGIAGARVDRIAAAAQANKNLIYVYYTNKETLFRAVFEAHVVRLLDEVPFTVADLPGYAGLLYDFFRANPRLLRLAGWFRLEQGDYDEALTEIAKSNGEKVAAIARAQADGWIDDRYPPEVVLTLVLATAAAWGSGNPVTVPTYDEPDPKIVRAAIEAAVRGVVVGKDSAA
ncbi:TetR family transcriptional regulator [Kutzneria kofuensis]|uniref:AcrR family transcriptional regulator n=1 Tax=Kutzneria kofuensis TaxID=103725 RepID=A0A7W9KQ46_9PSEU|nr:TetR family transcriptional regulator [Kutzneria kofuensis]MBB5896700.1 AcrR family transcriptional regulator [Kutzneria kofuensis]